MSGPITTPTGTSDGIDWTTRDDFTGVGQVGGGPMIYPAYNHPQQLTPPSYYAGPLPYYGDWQMTPSGFLSALRLVIEFSRPIKQLRTTAQFVNELGLSMYAVVDESDFSGIGGAVFVSPKFLSWGPNISGTRTLTYEPGFKFVVFKTQAVGPMGGQLTFGPTFRNTMFFEELPVVEPVIVPQPDLKVPRGAGRLLSFHWPQFSLFPTPNPQGIIVRPSGGGAGTFMNQSVIGAPPPGITQMTYRGMRCLRLPGGNGTGYINSPQGGQFRPFQMYVGTERMLKANLDGLDEIACWRFMGMLAFEQPSGPISRDCGLVIGPGVNTQIRGPAAQAGISLSLTDIDSLVVTTRAVTGGAAVEHPIALSTGFDIEDWHRYEIRLLSATSASDAICRLLIDDSPVLDLMWGTGTELPPPIEGTTLGYYWSVGNLGGSPDFTTRMYVAQMGVEVAAAMTEDALL